MSLAVPSLKQLGPAFNAQYQCDSRTLLRALLRECTYLPDGLARQRITKHVLSRFRAGNTKGLRALLATSSTHESRVTRLKALQELRGLQKQGYAALKHLQRANDGETKPLTKILYHTYGRAGRRRHEMLARLLGRANPPSEPDTPTAQESSEWGLSTVAIPDIFQAPANLNGEFVKYTISKRYSQLRALAESQISSPLPNGAQTHLRFAGYQMPAKNSWGRPMPRRRVRNIAKKKRLVILSRILPPLPEHEWAQLRGLITGQVPWVGQPARRRRITPRPDVISSFDIETLLHLKDSGGSEQYLQDIAIEGRTASSGFEQVVKDSPAQRHLKPMDAWMFRADQIDAVMRQILEDNIQLRHLSKRTTLPGNRGHRITFRFMRRLWIKVFQQCPTMYKDDKSGRWAVAWGSAPEPQSQPNLNAFAALFDYRLGSTANYHQKTDMSNEKPLSLT